jgi:uncharacterized membrane protein YfcA
MTVDPYIVVTGLAVGFIVGMTGMGGGALMTPILVLLFKVQPLAAVSSDLVASMIMKPVGGAVHWRRGTVHRELVGWLMLGSVPAAFAGVFIIKLLGHGHLLQQRLQVALGVVLVGAAAAIVLKAYLQVRRMARRPAAVSRTKSLRPRRLPTVLIGVVGGLVVGMTSVGSGSLIIVALMLLYPLLTSSELVGTDLVQAVPLVTAAALAHILFGDFRFGLTASILLGSIPGVYLGAKVSAFSPGWLVRPALFLVLLASGLKLVKMANTEVGLILLFAILAGIPFVVAYVSARRPQPAPVAIVELQLAPVAIVEQPAEGARL